MSDVAGTTARGTKLHYIARQGGVALCRPSYSLVHIFTLDGTEELCAACVTQLAAEIETAHHMAVYTFVAEPVTTDDPEFSTCSHGEYPDDCDACPAPVSAPVKTAGETYRGGKAPMLYDNLESQQLFILGECLFASNIPGILFLRENDPADRIPRSIIAARLRTNLGGRYTALCQHGYTQHDSCPNCDAADEAIHARAGVDGASIVANSFVGHKAIELGTIVFHADCTRSAINPMGDIVARYVDGDSWKTCHRALVLDHKRQSHHEALLVQEAREHIAPAVGDDGMADWERELVGARGNDDLSVEILVRTLISYGITTGEQFTAYAHRVLAHDEQTRVARPLVRDLIVGPAGMWDKPVLDGAAYPVEITTPPMVFPTMSAEQAYAIIDAPYSDFEEEQK